MDQIQLLNSKREQFHLQIRRRNLQDIFSKKRKYQIHDDELKPQYLELVNLFTYDMADTLYKINCLLADKPIIYIVKNNIAAIILQNCLNIKEAHSWDFFKDCLQYIGLLSRLDQMYLSPYLEQCNGLQGLIYCFLDTVTQIKQKEFLIRGNDDNHPLSDGRSVEDKFSYTYNMLIQILTNITQDCKNQREILLKDYVFLECLFKVAQIKQDQAVLVASLNLFGQILMDLKGQQDQKLMQKVSSMIRPFCVTLKTPNLIKKHSILNIILQFSKVKVEYGLSFNLVKFGLIENLISTLLQNNDNSQIDNQCIRIMTEMVNQTQTYTKQIYEKGFMQVIKSKIYHNNQNILSGILYLLGQLLDCQMDVAKEVYEDKRLIYRIVDIVQYSEMEARYEALFAICSLVRISSLEELIILNELKVIHILIDYVGQIQNQELQESIIKTIMFIIDVDKSIFQEFALITNSMKKQLQNTEFTFQSYILEQFQEIINYL